jgi:Domain of unknown function (DUF4214)/Glycosyl hydrolase catalytic core
MPFVRFAVALCAIATIIFGPAQAAEPKQADIIWGANGHPLISYPGVPIEDQLDALRDLGMRSYRVDITDTTYIAELRDIVREARARGITILPVVTPQFDLAQESVEDLEKKAYGLAFALVSSFKGQIPVWELGNEMENYAIIQPCEMQDDGKEYPCSYGPAGGVTSLEYYGPRWQKVSAVLKGLSRGAHDADPNVRRALGTAGWGHLGAFDRMKADGIEWDISVWHMYGEDPEWAFKKLKEFNKPIWVTEFNHSKGSVDGKEEQAQGLLRSMSMLVDLQETYGVEAAHVYELLDEPYWDDFEAHMGLIELKKAGDDKWALAAAKPAYAAVKERISDSATGPQEIVVQRSCELPYGPQAAALPAPTIVAYAFCLALGRDPDGAGAGSWSAELMRGRPIEQVVIGMLQSEEFAKRYNVGALSNREYVGLIQSALLGAPGSEQEIEEAAAEIDGGKSRAAFLAETVASKAFRTRHPPLFAKITKATKPRPPAVAAKPAPKVHRKCDLEDLSRPLEFERGQMIYSYCLVLGRWPDTLGLLTWTADRKKGLALEPALVGMLQSDEFAAKYETKSLDDAGYVTLLYRLLLSRDPDEQGLAGYVGLLQAGKINRPGIVQSILASGEFRSRHDALFTARMPARSRAEVH